MRFGSVSAHSTYSSLSLSPSLSFSLSLSLSLSLFLQAFCSFSPTLVPILPHLSLSHSPPPSLSHSPPSKLLYFLSPPPVSASLVRTSWHLTRKLRFIVD